MYRVILADDEKWSMYGLSKKIDWSAYQCEIIAMAGNGIAALEMCRKEKPDLLLSDIRMPGLDGLDLARCIALEMPEITVVLMTGYSDLQYAQSAVRLGVFDFLLKQITATDLDAMLKRFLEFRRKSAMMQTCGMYFSLFDESNNRSIAECLRDLCIETHYQRTVAYTFCYENAINPQQVLQKEQDEYLLLAFHTGTSQLTCYCFYNQQTPDIRNASQCLLDTPIVWAGISQHGDMSSTFYQLYEQSITAMLSARFWGKTDPVIYKDYHREPMEQLTEPLRKTLVSGQRERIRTLIENLLQNSDDLQIDCLQALLNRAGSLLLSFGEMQYAFLETLDLYQYVGNGCNREDLSAELRSSALSVPDTGADNDQLLSQIMQYIDQHFTENIRITDVAAHLYMNASYLSTLIRKKAGKTYTEIILGKRMEYARDLLTQTGCSVMEIAHRTGYQEYSHFHRLFRQVFGMTPAQFRQNSKSDSYPV